MRSSVAGKFFDQLIRAGADINMKDFYGNTLLYFAAGNRDQSFVSTLLALGADPNAQNGWGRAPIHYAAVASS